MAATDHNFKVKNGLDVLGGTASISGGHLTLTSNSYGVNTRSILARDTNGLNLGTSNGTTALSINNSGNITMPYNLTVTGNLTVNGTTTTLNTATLDVEDKNITLNYGSGDTSGSANGAGITIQDAVNSSTDATILWSTNDDRFDFSHGIGLAAGELIKDTGDSGNFIKLNDDTTNHGVNGLTLSSVSGINFILDVNDNDSQVFNFLVHATTPDTATQVGKIDDDGNAQFDGTVTGSSGLVAGTTTIANSSGAITATHIDATDQDFVVQDTNEGVTNIIWKDDSAGKLYLGTSTFPAEFRSDVDLQTGHDFKMNGTTVVDASRNAILQGLRASTTQSASSTTGINFTATDEVSNQNFTAVRIDHNASGTQTHTGDNSHYALFIDQDSSASGGDTTNEHRLYGIYSDQRISASGDSDVMYSIYGYSESQHSSGQVSGVYGGYFFGIGDETGTGHTQNIYGAVGQAQGNGTGSGGTSNLYGIYGKSLLSTACDKNTNLATGVYAEVEIDDPGQAQTLSAAYVVRAEYDDDSAGNVTVSNGYLYYGNVAGTPATNMYGLYFADDLRHYMRGTLEARGADTDISTALAYGFAGDRNTGMYTPANHVLGFASNGTERARLSGSDWLFHKQTSGLDGGGVEFASGGRARFTRDGANVIEINRKTSNGSLVTLYNGGSNLIGQINVINSVMALGTGAAGLIFNNSSDAIYPWNVASGTGSDVALDLGLSTRRWRDMYLGRTLYMNGGDIDLRNDTSGDNATIRSVNFKTTAANSTDDRVALISATTSGGTSTTRGGKLRFLTRDPNADTFNEVHITNAGNLNIVDGGLQTASTQRISNSGALTNISTATLSGSLYSNIAAGGTSMYLDTTTNASSGSVLYGPGIRWRQDDQTSIAGIRGAVASDGTNQLILGTGWLDQEVFIEPSRVRISGDLQVDGNDVKLAATNKRVKYSVWSNDTYGIGMHNTVTYGGINNDYAMTFQMNNDVDRGWLFLDSDDTLAQGAMALTTEGKLTVADSIRLGYGKNDTTSPGLNSLDLEVAGISKFDSQIRAGSGSQTNPSFSFASDTNTGFYRSSENVLGVATGGDTRAIFDDDAFQIEGGAGLRLKAGGRSDNPEGTYYNWFQTGAGTDTTSWWKICDVDIATGLYKALAMHIRVKSQYGNYGSTEQVVFSEYTALFPRSGAVQDDAGTPRLSGYDTENHELRIYKTGDGAYELQARMKINYRDLIVELQVLSTNGGTVTMNESLSAGTTSGGTAYTATEHTATTAPEFYTGKLVAPSLGIGTSDPQDLVHISADSPVLRMTNTTDLGKSSIEFWDNQSGTSQGGEIFYDDAGNLFGLQGNANGIVFKASNTFPGSELMRLESNGNLGLGTDNPSSRLQVGSSTTSSSNYILFGKRVTSSESNLPFIGHDSHDSTTSDLGLGARSTSGQINFYTGNASAFTAANRKMVLTSGGRLGIGTDDPASKLHLKDTGDTTLIIEADSDNSGESDNARLELRQDNNNVAGYLYTEGNADQTASGTIANATVLESKAGGNDVAIQFATGGRAPNQSGGETDGTVRMTILGNGNVGIGTTSVSSALSGSNTTLKIEDSDGADLRFVHTGGADFTVGITNSNTAYIWNVGAHNLLFGSSGSEKMQLTAAGNLGIGEDDTTSINDARLVIRDGNYASNQDGGIIIQAGDATGNHWRAGFKIKSGSGGTPRTVIETMSGTAGALVEALALSSTDGAATFNSHIIIPVNKGLYFGGGSHTYITEDVDDRLRFFTGGTEFMRFTEDTTNTLSLYQPVSANNIACTALQATGLIEADRFLSGLGTEASPAYKVGDTDSGFYDSGANEIGVSLGGTLEYEFTPTQLNLNSNDLAGAQLIKMSTNDYLDFDDDSQTYTGGTNATVLASVSDVAIRTNTNDGGGGAFTVVSGNSSLTTMLSMTSSGNATFAGTVSSGAITASGSSVFNPTSDMVIVNEPSTNTDLQTVMRVGTSAGGLYLTSGNAIVGKGAYYDGGWVATATSGSSIDFAANDRITFNTFSGATVGGTAAFGARAYIDASGLNVTGSITAGGATTTLGDSGTNGTINMRASSSFYLQQNGATRLTLNSSGITSGSNVYTSSSGTFRNYGGTWNASTGLTGNGFEFVNSVDGTAMTISSTGDVVCSGSLSATTKSFDIEHPTKEGMRLHHGSLEGPEHGVYIRGRNKGTVIELPEYWLGLVDEDTITVQLTAIGEPQNLCVTDIKDNKVYVKGVEYFYFIQAERKDIEKFEVEYAV